MAAGDVGGEAEVIMACEAVVGQAVGLKLARGVVAEWFEGLKPACEVVAEETAVRNLAYGAVVEDSELEQTCEAAAGGSERIKTVCVRSEGAD